MTLISRDKCEIKMYFKIKKKYKRLKKITVSLILFILKKWVKNNVFNNIDKI